MKRKTTPGLSVVQSIKDCIDYGKNPVKTEEGKYISAYECDPATVDAEFLLWKSRYRAATGREQKADKDVLCYQIRQSFLPGEITPEDANRIGYELAMRWTKGRHQFIVTTHTDKAISITTFITIPPPLTAPINTGTSSAPAVPWGGCPTPSVWKTASLW